MAFLQAQGVLGKYQKRHWNGKFGEIHTYRYADQLPLRGGNDALLVNWVELTITHEETGKVIYKNAFVTDFEVLETTVEAIARDGRARWKIENENNNVLKTKGYHLEHNFRHGEQCLSSLLLSLNLLAFLFHTVMGLVDEKYQLLRLQIQLRFLLSLFFDSNPPNSACWIFSQASTLSESGRRVFFFPLFYSMTSFIFEIAEQFSIFPT